MVNISSTAQSLSDDYAGMGQWIGLATDDPGDTSAPANEVSVGMGPPPGYARQQAVWNPGTGGVNQCEPVTFNLPSGEYPYVIVCGDSAGHTMIDYCEIDATLNSDGQIVVTPTYTQT
jgi:hypothetical protein